MALVRRIYGLSGDPCITAGLVCAIWPWRVPPQNGSQFLDGDDYVDFGNKKFWMCQLGVAYGETMQPLYWARHLVNPRTMEHGFFYAFAKRMSDAQADYGW